MTDRTRIDMGNAVRISGGSALGQHVRDDEGRIPSGALDPATTPKVDERKWDLEQLGKIGEFRIEGLVWVLSCNNEQTNALQSLLATLAPKLTVAAGPYAPQVAAAIGASIIYIEMMNRWGGNNGVDINGVVGTLGVIVTPRVGKLWGELLHAGRMGISARTVLDFLVAAAAKSPALATAFQVSGVAAVLSALQSGTPLGWALLIGIGLIPDFLKPQPDVNDHGAVMADRNRVAEWETFTMGSLEGNTVSILSWLGFFSAQNAGGAGVYANRPVIKDWETWTLVNNHDGTVSFRTFNGHYLTAENGGGRECQANRTQIGDWEKFSVVPLPSGQIALQARNGQFVSVQK